MCVCVCVCVPATPTKLTTTRVTPTGAQEVLAETFAAEEAVLAVATGQARQALHALLLQLRPSDMDIDRGETMMRKSSNGNGKKGRKGG